MRNAEILARQMAVYCDLPDDTGTPPDGIRVMALQIWAQARYKRLRGIRLWLFKRTWAGKYAERCEAKAALWAPGGPYSLRHPYPNVPDADGLIARPSL